MTDRTPTPTTDRQARIQLVSEAVVASYIHELTRGLEPRLTAAARG